MENNTLKFCKDCNHYQPGYRFAEFYEDTCLAILESNESLDLVTGEHYPARYVSCRKARSGSGTFGKCGNTAVLFEPREFQKQSKPMPEKIMKELGATEHKPLFANRNWTNLFWFLPKP